MTRVNAYLLLALALAMPLSLLVGRVWIDPFDPQVPNAMVILAELRLPRAILAVVLGLQDLLPRLEELRAVSRTACVLNEWIGLRQDQARIMDFLLKVCNVSK